MVVVVVVVVVRWKWGQVVVVVVVVVVRWKVGVVGVVDGEVLGVGGCVGILGWTRWVEVEWVGVGWLWFGKGCCGVVEPPRSLTRMRADGAVVWVVGVEVVVVVVRWEGEAKPVEGDCLCGC